jgi:hypothetical protein
MPPTLPGHGGAVDGKVFMKRRCIAHGEFSACIASDARFYWLAQGKEENRCCSGGACCTAEGKTAGTLGRNAEGRGKIPSRRSPPASR